MATNHYHSVDFTREANGETVTYNSYEDWGLYLTEPVVVSAPEPNTYMVEVPGRNGSLDLINPSLLHEAISAKTITEIVTEVFV